MATGSFSFAFISKELFWVTDILSLDEIMPAFNHILGSLVLTEPSLNFGRYIACPGSVMLPGGGFAQSAAQMQPYTSSVVSILYAVICQNNCYFFLLIA